MSLDCLFHNICWSFMDRNIFNSNRTLKFCDQRCWIRKCLECLLWMWHLSFDKSELHPNFQHPLLHNWLSLKPWILILREIVWCHYNFYLYLVNFNRSNQICKINNLLQWTFYLDFLLQNFCFLLLNFWIFVQIQKLHLKIQISLRSLIRTSHEGSLKLQLRDQPKI